MSDEIEKEIIYEFDTCISKDSYIKPLYGKISRKHIIIRRIVSLVMMGEITALIILDEPFFKILWAMFLIFIFIRGVFDGFLQRISLIKQYKTIHAAKEDCFTYTFYDDHVKVKSLTAEVILNYDTAEFIAENDKRMMIVFPFNRSINLEKSQCNEEQLAFFRNIVPKENQKKIEKKTAKIFFVLSTGFVLLTVVLAVIIAETVSTNARAYYPEYPSTTYISFEACLNAGTIENIVIINNEFIEYTYIGRGEPERYYTVYSGDDIDELTEKFDSLGVSWKFE